MAAMSALVALEDGTIFEGISFGAEGEAFGEVVFNTSMSGYQEILTDPSYKGQIVTMTYPLIGNYGVNEQDVESWKPHVEGFVVREYSPTYSNWRATGSLADYLKKHGLVAIEGVDTRALTKHIRQAGAMKAVISTKDLDPKNLVEKARSSPGLIGRDFVKEVTCSEPYRWEDLRHRLGDDQFTLASLELRTKANAPPYRVVALDCGVKYNILRLLSAVGCDVTVLPAHASPDEILALHSEGIFLSNGPGDPEGVPYVVETVRTLLPRKPIFGICLGHQILGLAMEGRTFKLKFGHRGGNQPVKDLNTGKVDITAQNHGFCVDMETLDPEEVELTHVNLNDQTLEGMRHRKLPIFSVQYHPEASPGPHDASYLFQSFVDMMEAKRG
jgi:carbamoyl-phosphate synthase small subunit